MKNIHILPTDKPSRLFTENNKICFILNTLFSATAKNIYITSDEEIKGSDWVKNISFEEPIFKLDGKGITYVTLVPHLKFKKIILTTDQDLIKDGVQAIDDEFLEWFVKNPSCEKVTVTNLYGDFNPIKYDYKIIIPKEEPKQEILEEIIDKLSNKKLRELDIFLEGAKYQEQKTIEDVFEWLTTNNYLTDLKETMIKDFNIFKNK